MVRKYFGIRPLPAILFSIVCFATYLQYKSNFNLFFNAKQSREQMLKHIHEYIKMKGKGIPFEGQTCKMPILDLNASEIVKFLKDRPIPWCGYEKDWVEIDGNIAKVSVWAKETFSSVLCKFTNVYRVNDEELFSSLPSHSKTSHLLTDADVIKVKCVNEYNYSWQKVLLGVRSNPKIQERTGWAKVPEDSLKLNVLMFGFDSLSHNMWRRKLPKTYNYAIQNLEGIALNGYNIVGDGTSQALIPILTGKTELELPDTRKKLKNAQYVNVYPFIWNEYQKNGYATLYAEDKPKKGTFTYRLKGFNEQPTDHYIRPFYIEASPFFNEEMHCYGQLSHMDIMINYIKDMYKTYKGKPKFMFSFHSIYTHESLDYASTADEGTVKFLQEFHEKNLLNDTLLILMSDHGSRFAEFRKLQQGKQEERLPGFIFVFPTWFKHKYPKAYTNFKLNADRLTTPFDIHEVLKNVLHFEGAGLGNIQRRGISLFKEVPISRSCFDAGIDPHWCACLDWETVPVTDPTIAEAALHLIDFINGLTQYHRKLCDKVHLKKILWSAKLLPNDLLMKFKNSDEDNLGVEMSDNISITTEIYQIKVLLNPGEMMFEASLRYLTQTRKFLLSESDISRINKYKYTAECIEKRNILHHLRKYCSCVKQTMF